MRTNFPKAVLVTGGAGFIGTELVKVLLYQGAEKVIVLDNLSSSIKGGLENITPISKLVLRKQDINSADLAIDSDIDTIFHLAANPDVRVGVSNPNVHFHENVHGTFNLLEAARRHGKISSFVLLSTSTVYGEASKIPTPEDYTPMIPISVYGASKLACEALLSSYSHICGFKALVYRLANVIGPKSNHGVVHDFICKLRENRQVLEILGDGSQTKSYLHVTDCVEGILHGLLHSKNQFDVYNLGSNDQINVQEIAEAICDEMTIHNVKFTYKNATPDGRGWLGDVKFMRLDISKMASLGWKPRLNSDEAVRATVREIINDEKTESALN